MLTKRRVFVVPASHFNRAQFVTSRRLHERFKHIGVWHSFRPPETLVHVVLFSYTTPFCEAHRRSLFPLLLLHSAHRLRFSSAACFHLRVAVDPQTVKCSHRHVEVASSCFLHTLFLFLTTFHCNTTTIDINHSPSQQHSFNEAPHDRSCRARRLRDSGFRCAQQRRAAHHSLRRATYACQSTLHPHRHRQAPAS